MDWFWLALGYLLGSTPTGYLAVKFTRGEDIRDFGSGNIGATNVGRVLGRQWAIAVALFDMLKGGIAVGIARYAGVDDTAILALVGLFGVLGHNFPVWLRFKGGKGVATSFGVLFFFHPAAAILGGIVWYVTMRVTRYVSVASMFSLATAPVWLIVVAAPVPFVLIAALLDLLTIVRHRPNVVRLLAGTENQVTLGRKVTDPPVEQPQEVLSEAPAPVVETVVVEETIPVEPDEMEDFLPAWSECPETVEYEEEPVIEESVAEDGTETETGAEGKTEATAGLKTVEEKVEVQSPAEAGKGPDAMPSEAASSESLIVEAEAPAVPEKKPAPRKRRKRKPVETAEAADAPEDAGKSQEKAPADKPAPRKRRKRKTVSDEA